MLRWTTYAWTYMYYLIGVESPSEPDACQFSFNVVYCHQISSYIVAGDLLSLHAHTACMHGKGDDVACLSVVADTALLLLLLLLEMQLLLVVLTNIVHYQSVVHCMHTA